MIKKYKEFLNEGVLDNLKGPTEEEIWNEVKDLDPIDMMIKSARIDYLKGVKHALSIDSFCKSYMIDAGIEAAKYDNIEIVKYLLEEGMQVNDLNSGLLHAAAGNGNTELVKLLIEEGADIDSHDCYALYLASRDGFIETTKVLLEHGAKVPEYIIRNMDKRNFKPEISELLKKYTK